MAPLFPCIAWPRPLEFASERFEQAQSFFDSGHWTFSDGGAVTLDELRAIVEDLPEPTLVLSDVDYRVLAASRAFRARLCGTSESPLGKTLDALLAPGEESASGYLRRCAGSADLLPGAVAFAVSGESIACYCDGMRLGAIDDTDRLIVGVAPPH